MTPSIVVLTGAGISAESGIRTFRAADGLWENHRVEDVATPEAYQRDAQLVHRFYNQRRQHLLSPDVAPNAAHMALAELEQALPGEVLVITQNIDNLHERAGSQNLIHMHGELLKLRCDRTGQVYLNEQDCTPETRCQCCDMPGNLRPDIVWFGEMPMQMDDCYRALDSCQLFLSIGTSGNVYPAAGFVEVANAAGARTLEVNLEPSRIHTAFEEHIQGAAAVEVPALVRRLLAE